MRNTTARRQNAALVDADAAVYLDVCRTQPMKDSLFAHNGTATSKAAADSMSPVTARTVRGAVLAYIQFCGDQGATREEIEHHLGIDGNTVRPRVAELLSMGKVKGSTQTRKTAAGRQAEVLVVA